LSTRQSINCSGNKKSKSFAYWLKFNLKSRRTEQTVYLSRKHEIISSKSFFSCTQMLG
jgi:hypothetical protein